jgi:hypothetical protein
VFDGTTYTNDSPSTNASGQVAFTLPHGNYHFRADKNGTQFWSGSSSHCTLPGCASVTVTTTVPVTVTVLDVDHTPQANVPVYAFDGTTCTNYSKHTNSSGQAVFTLPMGNYRFRADRSGSQYWSGASNHCTIPGCTSAMVSLATGVGLQPDSAFTLTCL